MSDEFNIGLAKFEVCDIQRITHSTCMQPHWAEEKHLVHLERILCEKYLRVRTSPEEQQHLENGERSTYFYLLLVKKWLFMKPKRACKVKGII